METSLIISLGVLIVLVINIIVTNVSNARKETRIDNKELNKEIGNLTISISEIKMEIKQIREDVATVKNKQANIEKEIDAIRKNSDDKRFQINMIEAHRHAHAHVAPSVTTQEQQDSIDSDDA